EPGRQASPRATLGRCAAPPQPAEIGDARHHRSQLDGFMKAGTTMVQAMTDKFSPLEQARHASRVELAEAGVQLSPADQATLKHVLESNYDYVRNDVFWDRDAEK